ncbi:ACBP4 [Symbiodinium natans]|uniref:ACBP4 protein n=1 Tax=Symbiodinium natans TaxID=878477 RepID=A0A812R5G3_9DINO|nr:ACBP4 [Symbiodinium natans]
MAGFGRALVEVISEDALVRICCFLPARPLLDMGATCVELHQRVEHSVDLWKALCQFLLGETSLLLHEGSWASSAQLTSIGDKARFYQRLFRAAWRCEDFCYDHTLRRSFLRSLSEPDAAPTTEAKDLLGLSGHTSETLGPLVIQIGGMKNMVAADELINVTVLNVRTNTISRPSLKEDSLKPLQRMRHATCVVKPKHLPASAFASAVLVLGGHDANTRTARLGRPRPALQRLVFLQVTEEEGTQIRWCEMQAFGTIPEYMYNLTCASFCGGQKVVVFGGDVPTSDDEYERIQDRTCCNFVYVLDLRSCTWEATRTRGPAPDWRSFHASVCHTSLLDGKDYLVTFGGTNEHCEPLSGGNLADMRGYQLDLTTFQWREGPSSHLPAPRLRFGVARWGRHLVIHGGHGSVLSRKGYVARLNLHTLEWDEMNFSNQPPELPHSAFETGSPQAGIVVGGAQQTPRGPRILQRLVVFRLRDVEIPDDGQLADGAQPSADEGSDEGEGFQVQVHLRNSEGSHRVVSMPAALLHMLQRESGTAEGLVRLLQAVFEERLEDHHRSIREVEAQNEDQGEPQDAAQYPD